MSAESQDPRVQVSIVVPVFNEEDSLAALAREIAEALAGSRWGDGYEVLFVDDGSTDRSLDVLRRLAAGDPRLQVVAHRRNAGQSAAFSTGFDRARGEWIVTLDADLQNDPADIPRLLAEAGEFDVVSGVRADRRDTALRRLASRIANGVRRFLLDDGIRDVGCSLKVYRADLLRGVPRFDGMHRFLPALVRRQGGRIKEMTVHHRPRVHGEAKYTIRRRLVRTVPDLLAVRWMFSRWIDRRNVRPLESAAPPEHSDRSEPGAGPDPPSPSPTASDAACGGGPR